MFRYVLLFLIVSSFLSVQADLIEFSDQADFFNQTGATSASGAYPNLNSSGSPSVTLGDVTITTASSTLFIGQAGDWTPLIPGHDIAISGPEHLDLDFANPVFALGYQMVDDGSNSVFTVTLKNQGNFVDSFTYDSPGGQLFFVGVTSDAAFDRAEIRETTGGAENEYFGEFFISTNDTNVVPEPSSLVFLLLATVSFLTYRKS